MSASASLRASCGQVLFCLLVLPLLWPAAPAAAWGDRTHRALNRLAVKTLPAPARAYFERYTPILGRRAVEPDTIMRARDGRREAVRHFIDLDALMQPPFTGFPQHYRDARRRFGTRKLRRSGVLPWVILRFERQLRAAILRRNRADVIREAAYLGHYAADAFQPLHLTENYDGQKSGGKGVHHRFEQGLVDARLERYLARSRRYLHGARPLANPRADLFAAMFRTYADVAPLLDADRRARHAARAGTAAYFDHLAASLGPLVPRQLARAADLIGSLWLGAWREAGSPRPSQRPRH